MLNLDDMAYFAKNVIRYNATKVKDYIWNFKVDDLEYLCHQFGMPYFPLEDPWEKTDVFEEYKDAVLLTKEYVRELQRFHRKYYVDMKEVVAVTEHACILLNTLWKNIIWRCEETDTDEFHRVAFPVKDMNHVCETGFPKDE